MSTIYLTFTHRALVDGVQTLTDVASVVAEDPGSTYGVKRDDTDGVVVASGTALTWQSTGVYQLSFTAPANGLSYTWYPKWVYSGKTKSIERNYTEPSQEPVTVTECKLYAHIDTDADDTTIDIMITAAREWAENYSGRTFMATTFTEKMDSFENVIELPYPPLASVTSITYIDTDGASQTVSTDIYDVDTTTEPGLITLAYNQSWPDVRSQHNAVTITYVAGYGTSSFVPDKFKIAIMQLVANMDINREATSPIKLHEVPFGVMQLLGIDRIIPV